MRSLRDASASLREEWQGALAFGSTMGAGYLGDAVERLKADSAAAFDIVDIRRGGLGARLQGVKAPSNLSVEVNAVQARVPADSIARPFAFLQESAGTVSSREAVSSLSDVSAAASVSLDWGDARYLGRFLWNEEVGGYLREVAGWPFACYPTARARMTGDEGAMVRPAFANVICNGWRTTRSALRSKPRCWWGRAQRTCLWADGTYKAPGRGQRVTRAPSTGTSRAGRCFLSPERPGSPSFLLMPR